MGRCGTCRACKSRSVPQKQLARDPSATSSFHGPAALIALRPSIPYNISRYLRKPVLLSSRSANSFDESVFPSWYMQQQKRSCLLVSSPKHFSSGTLGYVFGPILPQIRRWSCQTMLERRANCGMVWARNSQYLASIQDPAVPLVICRTL